MDRKASLNFDKPGSALDQALASRSRSAAGENILYSKQDSVTHRLSLSLSYRPDMTERLLKRMSSFKASTRHPFSDPSK